MLTKKELNDIIKFITQLKKVKFTKQDKSDLYVKFCVNDDDIKDKVYWSFTIDYKCCGEQFRQGIISKNVYDVVKLCNPEMEICFYEQHDYCYLNPQLNEISFSEKKEDILKFLEGKQQNEEDLFEYLKDDDEFYDKYEKLYPDN